MRTGSEREIWVSVLISLLLQPLLPMDGNSKRYYCFQTNLNKPIRVENRAAVTRSSTANVIFPRFCPTKEFEKMNLQFYMDNSAKAANRFAEDRSKRFPIYREKDWKLGENTMFSSKIGFQKYGS